jgi:DNA-binding beta-propeller fold protein YncE
MSPLASGNVTTAAGGCLGGFADGYASKSRFRHPADVAIAPDGTVLYVADSNNRRVRAVSLSDVGALVGLAPLSPRYHLTPGPGWHFHHVMLQSKTHSVDDSQYVPCSM